MARDTFDFMDDGRRDRGRFGDNEAIRGNDSVRSDLIDIAVALHYETPPRGVNPGAVLVSCNGDEVRAQWIPKSRCEIERQKSFMPGRKKDGTPIKVQAATLTLSERLAKDKGLI